MLRRYVSRPCPWLAVLACCLLDAGSGAANWLRPQEGSGYFRFTCDLVAQARPDGQFDAVLLVTIPHRELTFQKEAGSVRSRVRAHAMLCSAAGDTVQTESTLRLTARSENEAVSTGLHQIFSIVLPGIDFDSGVLHLTLEDLNRRRPVMMALATRERAAARLTAEWAAPPPRPQRGLAVGSAVFLAHAPIRLWQTEGRGGLHDGEGPWDYANPARRFGLEAEAVQVYFLLEPPGDPGDRLRAAGRDLRLEVASERLDFSLVDTLRLTSGTRQALGAGSAAAVYWEMDAGGLPPGSYRLGIAPLDTVGRALLTGFDVLWGLREVTRDPRDLLGEGRTVLQGDALEAFERATNAEREVILSSFWADLDPSPGDPYNEVRAEFQRRVDYIRTYLGGFDENGASDPRGAVYLLLGEPERIIEEPVPMNQQELEDARVLVYEPYAPERMGSLARGGTTGRIEGAGTARGNFTTRGAIPMPYSYMADVKIRSSKTAADIRVFQLWRYDHSGEQLFPNRYTGASGGLRFLFVDRSGRGDFVLDSSNARFRGD